jgi:hypothetical protein
VIANARHAIHVMEECDVDLILSGHMHVAYIGNTLDFYPTSKRGIIIVQSGTTTSARGKQRERGKNSFNVIRVHERHIGITHHLYDSTARRFLPMSRHLFPRRLPGPYYLRLDDAAAAEAKTAAEEQSVQRGVEERIAAEKAQQTVAERVEDVQEQREAVEKTEVTPVDQAKS